MARKNGMKNDTNSSFTFNTRTKAVMADVVQDNIKEKVTSVREVVRGKSNNEIVLVLQYYDYDVEKTIQAYVEGGAKEALQQWQFSGTKPVKKKRNKKKVPASEISRSPESVSSESGSAASFMVNGEASREHVINWVLDHEPQLSRPSKSLTNGPTSGTVTYHVSNTSNITANSSTNNNTSSPLPDTKSSEVKVTPPRSSEDKGAKEKSPSPQHQRQHQSHHHHGRPRAHSGSHDHYEGRDRTISTSSVDSKSGKKNAHLGLERSAKDLHRQTVSLERLRLIFIEEVDKSHKRMKSVFDEIRTRLSAKENLLMGQLDELKHAGEDVFTMRQGLASDLKTQIDRAETMKEEELANLRLEIKHFVSDRKVDEDLAKTIRFLYDDKLRDDISVFGEIVPLKCQYVQQRSSFSQSKPEVVKTEPVHIPKPKIDTKPSDSRKPMSVPHLDSSQTEEMAQLQRRLKHSLTLEGIAVENFPERPESAPVPSNNVNNNSPRPDSARRNYNRNRRRNDRPRPETVKEESRGSFNQTPGGERVILIGRKTGPQASGRPRGGGGRGRGRGRGGYSGTGRPQNYNNDNVNNSNNGPQNNPGSGSLSEPRAQSASPAKPQRENRRGSGRGGRRSTSNPGGAGNSPTQSGSNTSDKKEG